MKIAILLLVVLLAGTYANAQGVQTTPPKPHAVSKSAAAFREETRNPALGICNRIYPRACRNSGYSRYQPRPI